MNRLRCTCCNHLWATQAEYDDHILYMVTMGVDMTPEEE